jgi:hypothetical protein
MPRGRPIKGTMVISHVPLYLELWNRAHASPHGIKIKPGPDISPHTFAGQLYSARRECGHTAYNGLRVIEAADGYIWIVPR